MRNLNKFIAENNYGVITAGKYVVTVKKEEVTIRITRHGVNNYNVTFIKNDRRYSYKCQSQKEVIETIKNDIAYHDSAAKETADENEFAELEKSLNDTEEYKEVISARNAHMSNADRLQAAISRTFGAEVKILTSNERYLLIRYDHDGKTEFATFTHDWDSISLGHYFTADEFSKARDSAIADYYERSEKDNLNILKREVI